jgi:chemotaxis response regulator CheB
MADKITVLLVDDHALVRRGFRRLLEDDSDIAVVGEGSNGEDAIRLMTELQPHVIVMDAAMPGTSGLAATRAIMKSTPAARILMLSMHAEETLVRQAMSAGARSAATDLRWPVEQGDREKARAQREHGRRTPRQHHEHVGRAQDRRARRLCPAERTREPPVIPLNSRLAKQLARRSDVAPAADIGSWKSGLKVHLVSIG